MPLQVLQLLQLLQVLKNRQNYKTHIWGYVLRVIARKRGFWFNGCKKTPPYMGFCFFLGGEWATGSLLLLDNCFDCGTLDKQTGYYE